MGRFLLAFFTLSTLFLMALHATADGSAGNSGPDPPNLRPRTLLQSPGTEESIADSPAEKVHDHERETAEAPESRRMGKHRSSDGSVAGGGVIVGGLVTAIFAAVCCYIRVTRRRRAEVLT
ncbi:hypothetical protein Pfo_022323 [Paulownia fortunei]|nr:hypothetical protein Pfo_022323 [Paulownia fortunei]